MAQKKKRKLKKKWYRIQNAESIIMYPQHKYNYKMLLKQHKMLVTLEQMLVVCYIDCYSQTILINAI